MAQPVKDESDESKHVSINRGTVDSFSFFLDQLHEGIDRNLRYVKLVPWLVSGVGVLLIVRQRYLITQFKRLGDLPKLAFLRGLPMRVIAVEKDHIAVCHDPMIRRLLGLCRRGEDSQMKVRLAGLRFPSIESASSTSADDAPLSRDKVIMEGQQSSAAPPHSTMEVDTNSVNLSPGEEISPSRITNTMAIPSAAELDTAHAISDRYGHPKAVITALNSQLGGQRVHTHFMQRQDGHADVLLYHRQGFFRVQQLINEEVLRQGLAASAVFDSEHLSETELVALTARLLKAELLAQLDGVGIWYKPRPRLWQYCINLWQRLRRK